MYLCSSSFAYQDQQMLSWLSIQYVSYIKDLYIHISEFSIVVAKILNYLVEVISKCPVIMHVVRAKKPVQNGRTTAVGA